MLNIKGLASSSSGNCYAIDDGHSLVMIEAGIPWKSVRQKLNFQSHNISFAMVSHEHGDHASHVKDVVKAGIDVYASPGTIDALRLTGHRVHPVHPQKQFSVDGWTILPFDTQHEAIEPLGFLLDGGNGDRLLFAIDTFYLKYRFRDLSYIMIECNYSKPTLAPDLDPAVKRRLYRNHMSLETTKDFLRANDLSRVREIHLLHLSSQVGIPTRHCSGQRSRSLQANPHTLRRNKWAHPNSKQSAS